MFVKGRTASGASREGAQAAVRAAEQRIHTSGRAAGVQHTIAIASTEHREQGEGGVPAGWHGVVDFRVAPDA